MAGIPVRQSASKEEFLRALGLNEADNQDRWKLRVMWEEVVNYWVTHFETPSRAILKPEYASNAGVQPPYKWAHLSPTTVDAAIAEIWGNGGQWPRHFYDMGYSKDRKVYNWVLKWLLWHVCRYRDWRNRRARNGSGTAITNNETAVPRAADGEPVEM
ncbi:hypothetical protein MMC14_003556 [Varicellaria rhodocarpa]|nr:hypothetical protein [Varicellaria rhodocarpa]